MVLAPLLVIAGCSSPRSAERLPPPPPQPQLAAASTFLEGAIAVDATFGAFDFKGPTGGAQREPGTERPARGDRPGPPMGMGGGGGMEGGERPRRSAGGAGGGGSGGGAMSGPLRQSLSITLRNTSEEPIQLRVAEVKTIFGSFIPEPETFTLEPGASQSLEPIRVGARENLTELHLTLRLRTVEANETQTLVLKASPTD